MNNILIKESGIPDNYVDALCKEITYRLQYFNIKELETIYIGGGTPSLLNCHQLKSIFNTIKENAKVTENCEITIEANPDDITRDLLLIWEEIGVNRISVGIQSFSNSALSFVSRRATSEINKAALNLIKKYWKKEISLDLICGLPCEKNDDIFKDVKTILEFRPDHISMYSLIIEDETPLGKELLSGKFVYDFDQADELWIDCKNLLVNNGYIQYEVSNFSLEGMECRHNLKYWNHESYLGCGSGATGSAYYEDGTGIRWTDIKDINKYIKYWLCNDNNIISEEIACEEIACIEKIDMDISIFEFFMMGLRKIQGISTSDFRKIFNKDIPPKIIDVFNKWQERGLCQIEKKQNETFYTLGKKGIIYLNKFLEEIL